MTNRAEEIRAKLDYAFSRLKDLQREISRAQSEDASVEHLGIVAGEILSQCRECFDYAIREFRARFPESFYKQNLYFPFNKESLSKLPIRKEGEAGSNLNKYLSDLIMKIDSQEDIPKTMTDYGILRTANYLVNEKKHSSLLRTYEHPDQGVEFTSPAGSMTLSGFKVYDKSKHCLVPDGSPMDFQASEGAETRLVKGFLFSYNDADVHGFLMNCIRATQRVLSSFCAELLSEDEIVLNVDSGAPSEQMVTKEKKEAFDKIFPIFCRPVVVALKSEYSDELVYKYDVGGNLIEVGGERSYLASRRIHENIAKELRYIFYKFAQERAMRDMKNKIDSEWEKIKSFDPKSLRVFELHIRKLGVFDLFSDTKCIAKEVSVIIIGFGMHFNTEDKQQEYSRNEKELLPFWRAFKNGIRSRVQFCHSDDEELRSINVFTEQKPPKPKVYWAIGPTISLTGRN